MIELFENFEISSFRCLNRVQHLELSLGGKFHCPSAGTIDFGSVQSSRFYQGLDHKIVNFERRLNQ